VGTRNRIITSDGLIEELTETEYREIEGKRKMVAITNFDATGIVPVQGGSIHPPAKNVPFQIGNTYGRRIKIKLVEC